MPDKGSFQPALCCPETSCLNATIGAQSLQLSDRDVARLGCRCRLPRTMTARKGFGSQALVTNQKRRDCGAHPSLGIAQRSLAGELLGSLFRFAWAMTGDEMGATELTQKVLADDSWCFVDAGGSPATEVALFSAAYRLFAKGEGLPVPPLHDRVATIGKLSLQHADALTSDALLRSFRELELPQRAALVLFYTTQCSLHDIAACLQRTSLETVAILSRAKAEWLHILEHSADRGDESPEGGHKLPDNLLVKSSLAGWKS